jgi:hypothetical protein
LTFSILHPSARPDQWEATCKAWLDEADRREDVQYILCADTRWGFKDQNATYPHIDNLVFNQGRRCWVDAVNTAAKVATGDILIVVADDIWPYKQDSALSATTHWDTALRETLRGFLTLAAQGFAVEVSTGTPAEHERKILAAPIISRALYEKWRYVLFPGYESMYADNDIFEHADSMGCLIDARHIQFEHRHPLFTGAALDEVYKHQNRAQAYEFGRELLEIRRRTNFGEPAKPKLAAIRKKPTLAVMAPGEWFPSKWVGNWTDLIGTMESTFSMVHARFGESSNVYAMRNGLAASLAEMQPSPDFVLWIDDDQILTPENLTRLYQDFVEHPEIDIVAGWAWRVLPGDEWVTSVWALNSKAGSPMTFEDLMSGPEPLKPVSQSGFPAVLMKYSAIQKAGPNPFLPLIDPEFMHGMSGEDTAFFVRARLGGAKCYVDRRVLVPHLKLGVLEPAKPMEQVRAVS